MSSNSDDIQVAGSDTRPPMLDQNAIDKKYGEIEHKNILITNENLIANCIAQDVFYTVTDSTLSASRFNDLSTAYIAAMNRVVVSLN
ncbi:hypothetical protein Tco_0679457 [Tanacetum coccineum]|uniref:Uncharacterized protein n=1 Tax=Tanacetum coccineum TaxID=301880 RepID=A0ABQ4XIV3_9ASTR